MTRGLMYRIKLFFSSIWFGRTYREWKLRTQYPGLHRLLKEE